MRNDVLLYGTHNYEFRKTFNVLYQHETNQQRFEEIKKKKKLAELKHSEMLPQKTGQKHNFFDGSEGGPYNNNFSTQVMLARNAQALFVLPGASSTLQNNHGESSPTSFGEGSAAAAPNEDSGIVGANSKNRGGRRNRKEPHPFQRHWLLKHCTNRETGKFHFYIHPDSRFKQVWSFVIVLFLLYVAFLMPYFIAF